MTYAIGQAAKSKVTVEIGIGQQPNGTYFMGLLALENEGEHTAIDVAQSPINRARQIVERFELPVTILQFDSKAIAWSKPIDLLYIDGGHSYDQVKGDIDNFAKHVRRTGYMIFDDYGKRHLQVTEAVDDYLASSGQWQTFQLPHLWWMMCRRL